MFDIVVGDEGTIPMMANFKADVNLGEVWN